MTNKLVIFDCDGTLVDSEYLCNLALQQQLESLALESSVEDLVTKYRGGKLASIIRDIENTYAIKLPETFEQDYRSKVRLLFDDHLVANEGVAELLRSLTIPFCIASSAPKEKIEHALQVTGLDRFFQQNIFSSYDIQSWKPEPDLFLHAARETGFSPSDCYVVEDSLVGIEAAERANMRSFYYSPNPIVRVQSSSTWINHMSKLKEHLT